MPDVFTKSKRSEVMSRIRGSGNKETELALVAVFRQHSITGWRRKQSIVGKPDFAFLKARVAVFVDGCFWHACPKHANLPRSNRSFWREKLRRNKERDRYVTRRLRREGWKVIRIWEHDLQRPAAAVARIRRALTG